MKTLERILAFVIMVSLILKFNLISGSDILAFFAILSLAGIYYPLGFLFFNQIRLRDTFKKSSYQNVSALGIVFAIVTGLGLSTLCIGAQFKLFNYEGADQMLIIGFFVTGIVFVVSLVRLLKWNVPGSKFILWRIGIIGGIGIVLFFTSSLTIVKLQYRNHPGYVEAYEKHLADPMNETLWKDMELEYKRARLTDEDFKKYEKSIHDKAIN